MKLLFKELILVNTIASGEQFNAVQSEIDKNQAIIAANNRNIDLSKNDTETQKKNEAVRQAYDNLNKIENQLKEYEDKLKKDEEKKEQNRLDEINEQEMEAEQRLAALRKDISDFNAEGDATIRLQNGAYITNNAIKQNGKGIEVISKPGENGLSDTQVAIKYSYKPAGSDEPVTVERLVDTNDKYTLISQRPEDNEDNEANKKLMGDKGLLETLKSSTTENPVKLKAQAFNKENGKAIDMNNVKEGDGIPTEIEVGRSKTPEEIEKGLNSTELLSSTEDLERLKNDPNYRQTVITALEKAQDQNTRFPWQDHYNTNVLNADYWAKNLIQDNFDPTGISHGDQASLKDTINRALTVVAPAPETLISGDTSWVTKAEKVRTISDRNTPTEEYRLTLTPEQHSTIQVAFAGEDNLFNIIKDNSNQVGGNILVTLNKEQYQKVETNLTRSDDNYNYNYFNPKKTKITINPNAQDYAGIPIQVTKKNEDGDPVVVGLKPTVNTSLLPDDVRMRLANEYAKNNRFGTNPLDFKRPSYDTLKALRNGGIVEASLVEKIITNYNSNIT